MHGSDETNTGILWTDLAIFSKERYTVKLQYCIQYFRNPNKSTSGLFINLKLTPGVKVYAKSKLRAECEPRVRNASRFVTRASTSFISFGTSNYLEKLIVQHPQVLSTPDYQICCTCKILIARKTISLSDTRLSRLDPN